jgi:hypothetical protein
VWNMGLGSYPRRNATENWRRLSELMEGRSVDVALLNEASVPIPSWVKARYSMKGTKGRDRTRSGGLSAVFRTPLRCLPLKLLDTYHGTAPRHLVAAKFIDPERGEVVGVAGCLNYRRQFGFSGRDVLERNPFIEAIGYLPYSESGLVGPLPGHNLPEDGVLFASNYLSYQFDESDTPDELALAGYKQHFDRIVTRTKTDGHRYVAANLVAASTKETEDQ